ncbi:unnamed protein product [Owenia fusiformis]|uniref:Uncharacterized protein n=1 Tax=Owenia fusiformis TaxID=6347 RepID=A0A8J1U9L8_OWEFU|nr:unnamed protein product [Owenia fusiformis]
MRLKFEKDDPKQYRCCCCCHVRTGTILLGILILFGHILVMASLALLLIHPDVLEKYNEQTLWQTNVVDQQFPKLQLGDMPPRLDDSSASNSIGDSEEMLDIGKDKIVLGKKDDGYLFNDNWSSVFSPRKKVTQEDVFVAFLITFISLAFAAMLVYGAAKGRPSYLMPFFCVQVFAFCLTVLSVVGYFTYMPDVKQYISMQELPFKDELLKMDNEWLCLIVAVFFCFTLFIKAYLIGMVWACYKFLTRKQVTEAVNHYFDGNEEGGEMLLPPKYEDIVDQPANPPPPAYTNS